MEEFKRRREIASDVGAQQAAYAKAGVVPTTGSPIDVLTTELSDAYLDLAIDRYNSEVAARSYENQAQNERYYGRQRARAANVTAVTSLLKTGADLAYSQTGGKKRIGE